MPAVSSPAPWLRPSAMILTLMGGLAVSACSGVGGGAAPQGLAPGLVAAMDQPGARLDQGAAFSILNQYRATRGVAAFEGDPALTAQAESLARAYAQAGSPPAVPAGTQARFSAGYANFAETFSGWRSTPEDARVLATGTRAGLAVVYDAASEYGTHWVLLVQG